MTATERVFDPYLEPQGGWVEVTVSTEVGATYATYVELSAALFAVEEGSLLIDAKGEGWVVVGCRPLPRGPWGRMRLPVTLARVGGAL